MAPTSMLTTAPLCIVPLSQVKLPLMDQYIFSFKGQVSTSYTVKFSSLSCQNADQADKSRPNMSGP